MAARAGHHVHELYENGGTMGEARARGMVGHEKGYEVRPDRSVRGRVATGTRGLRDPMVSMVR